MRLLTIAALVAFSASTCMRTDASPLTLACRIEPQAPLTAGGPVAIRFLLTNPSQEPVWFLKWNTPFEGWMGTVFTVSDPGGTELPYTGPMVKRGDPARDEYVEIPPGGTVDAVADLANVYDLSEPGRYRLEVTGGLADLTTDPTALPRPRAQHQEAALRCGSVEIMLDR